MIKNKMTKALSVGVLAGITALSAEAGDNASLLKKLVEKGVITQAEADALIQESNDEFNDALPSWVNSITLKGDLRLRYDHTHDSTSDGASAESRWRYRFRFGGAADINNGFKVGFRLASGGDDQGSTNQTFDGGFANDSLNLDQAYVGWKQNEDWSEKVPKGLWAFGGKNPNFEKTGWKLSKAFFDGDITPEGFEAHYATGGDFNFGVHGGAYFIRGEDSRDPKVVENMFMGQLTASTKVAGAGLDLGLGAYSVDDSGVGRTSKRAGNSSSGVGYTPVFVDTALNFKEVGPGIKVYSTWANNQEGSATKDTAYLAGIKFGSAKEAGQWEAKYEYRNIEKDAVWDELNDSDFGAIGAANANEFGSGTNVKGSVIQGKYMLYENVSFTLTWMITESEDGTDDETNNRIQADLIFKF